MVIWMYLNKATYERIEQLRNQYKIRSINKLCNDAGVQQSTVYNLIDGTTENPGSLLVLRICRELNISLKEFYDSPLFDNLEDD